jgi:hypothetical protein
VSGVFQCCVVLSWLVWSGGGEALRQCAPFSLGFMAWLWRSLAFHRKKNCAVFQFLVVPLFLWSTSLIVSFSQSRFLFPLELVSFDILLSRGTLSKSSQ